MPRAYETLHEKTVFFQRVGQEPTATCSTALEVAKRHLEAVDTATKISQNELGYHALKYSGLFRDAQRVVSRAEETYDFVKISQTLKNLFSRGTHTHTQTLPNGKMIQRKVTSQCERNGCPAKPGTGGIGGLEKSDFLTFRMIRTDKNEATRRGKSYREYPLKAKGRGVLPGYRDKQLLNGPLNTDAPTF